MCAVGKNRRAKPEPSNGPETVFYKKRVTSPLRKAVSEAALEEQKRVRRLKE